MFVVRCAVVGFPLLSANVSAFFLSTGVLEILTFVKYLLLILLMNSAFSVRLFAVLAEVCHLRTLA